MEHRITELQKSQKILHDKIMHLKSNQTVALHTPIIRHISKRICYIKTTRPIATHDVVLDNMFHFRNELNPVSTFQMAAYIFSDPADASSISTALECVLKIISAIYMPHFTVYFAFIRLT